MSASPPAATVAAPSQKRPLEDPSSPSGPTDQPEAKRPALDKISKADDAAATAQDLPEVVKAGASKAAGAEDAPAANGTSDSAGPDASADAASAQPALSSEAIDAAIESATSQNAQPIQSTTGNADRSSPSQSAHQDESAWIHIRAVISSAEAATVIGKGGENVTQIRRLSGAKCTVSDYSRGAVERILTVSGLVDAAAKAFGLIIRTLNNEPLEAPSTPQSKTYPLRLLVPHILIGSIIGKSGVRIREIQEASGARLNASDSCLPLSTERSLVVLGVADAVHIATYYVASTLREQLTERFGGPAASAYATRSGGPAGVVPGGMQVVPYVPQPVGGSYGHPDTYKGPSSHHQQQRAPPPNPYGMPYGHGAAHQAPHHVPQHQHVGQPAQAAMHYGSPQPQYAGAGPQQPAQAGMPGQPPQTMQGVVPGQPLTQQIFIPNDMVGAIIGKGGQKINEIRQLSGSVIKINEPQDDSNERLVTIRGTQECNQMALYMLYSRLESEKHRM